jgi:hypothetical protein
MSTTVVPIDPRLVAAELMTSFSILERETALAPLTTTFGVSPTREPLVPTSTGDPPPSDRVPRPDFEDLDRRVVDRLDVDRAVFDRPIFDRGGEL